MTTRTWLRLGGLSLLVVGLPMILWMAEPGAAAPLPDPRTDSDRSLEKTIQQRRSVRSYGDQSLSDDMMEVGHAGQNLLLQAVALDLVAVPIGAFDDDATAQALDLPSALRPLYLIPVGYPR